MSGPIKLALFNLTKEFTGGCNQYSWGFGVGGKQRFLPGSWILSYLAAATANSLQLCPTLCDPIDGSPPSSPVPGILQARTLEWVAISFSNAGKWKVKVKSFKSCPTLNDPMDCSLPGSSIHGIFQAGVLEWGAIAFSYLILGPVKLYVLKYHSWNMMCMDMSNKYRARTYCSQCSSDISAFCWYVFDVLIFIYNKSNLHES